jgi:hypothetical protein
MQRPKGFHMSMQEPNLIGVSHNDCLQVLTWLVINTKEFYISHDNVFEDTEF